MIDASPAASVALLLRMGDNALVLGQRLAEWTGRAPALEEDLALTNVALDLVGHARLWLSYAGEREGRGRDEDALAYLRDQREYQNVLLVERPNGDYAFSTVRSFCFDVWHLLALRALATSRDERIAAIAEKAAKEVAYHVRRSGAWVVRLGDGTEESHRRAQAALDAVWPYTGELFAPDALDEAAFASGIGCDLASLRDPWLRHVEAVLAEATLALPQPCAMHAGGKSGRHTEALSYLLAEMQSVARAVPAQRW